MDLNGFIGVRRKGLKPWLEMKWVDPERLLWVDLLRSGSCYLSGLAWVSCLTGGFMIIYLIPLPPGIISGWLLNSIAAPFGEPSILSLISFWRLRGSFSNSIFNLSFYSDNNLVSRERLYVKSIIFGWILDLSWRGVVCPPPTACKIPAWSSDSFPSGEVFTKYLSSKRLTWWKKRLIRFYFFTFEELYILPRDFIV